MASSPAFTSALHIEPSQRGSVEWQPVNPAFPGLQRVSVDPPIYAVHGFLAPHECEALCAMAAPGLKRSIVVDGTVRVGVVWCGVVEMGEWWGGSLGWKCDAWFAR